MSFDIQGLSNKNVRLFYAAQKTIDFDCSGSIAFNP